MHFINVIKAAFLSNMYQLKHKVSKICNSIIKRLFSTYNHFTISKYKNNDNTDRKHKFHHITLPSVINNSDNINLRSNTTK